jgi:hypothetical protein
MEAFRVGCNIFLHLKNKSPVIALTFKYETYNKRLCNSSRIDQSLNLHGSNLSRFRPSLVASLVNRPPYSAKPLKGRLVKWSNISLQLQTALYSLYTTHYHHAQLGLGYFKQRGYQYINILHLEEDQKSYHEAAGRLSQL